MKEETENDSSTMKTVAKRRTREGTRTDAYVIDVFVPGMVGVLLSPGLPHRSLFP